VPDESVYERLKRRKLVQWALAYLAGAFVVFQGVEVLADPWNISPPLQRAVHILLVFGLFVTLILAWYHGEKGRQRVSGPELVMMASLLVVAGVALSVLGSHGESGPAPGSAPSPLGDDRPSILVLACDNISPNPDDVYLADGIHDAILLRLAKISGLRSLGRETAVWYRDNPAMPSEIAATRGLNFVGGCSVRKDADRERILVTFRLLDARGTHVWSEEYDRNLSTQDLFDIQSDIARRVAQEMQAVLAPEEEARIASEPTEHMGAYNSYVLGRHWWNRRTPEGLRRAIQHFQEAIAIDSSYALAYAGLADSYALLPPYTNANASAFADAVAAAEKALELDPELASAHASLGFVKTQTFDWEGALQAYRRAIELDPEYAMAHQWYGQALSWVGRTDEAVVESRKALDLDPLSAIGNRNLGEVLLRARQYEAAERQFRWTLELHPDFTWTWHILGLVLIQLDRFAEAAQAYVRNAQLNGGDPGAAQRFVDLVAEHKRTGLPVALPVDFDIQSAQWDPSGPPVLFALLGQRDHALEWLERIYEERPWSLMGINVNPSYDSIRDDPRFVDLLGKMGLVE
jgi:serine/threonine-protein kinase